jgi:hypothetical protein
MDSQNLTRWQVRHLCADLADMVRYLNALCGKLQQLRFPENDPIDRHARAARAALQNLFDAARTAGQPEPKPLREGDEPRQEPIR